MRLHGSGDRFGEQRMVWHRVVAWFRGDPVPLPEVCDAPVLIAGAPKSGTTAIARLLGIATGSEVASDPFHLLDQRGIRFRDALYRHELPIARLIDAYPDLFSAPIIKDPNFTFFPEPLIERFPRSPFIFIVRDPRSNIRSILDRVGIRGDANPAEAEQRIGGLPPTWRRVLLGRTPDVPGTDFIERLAWRWNLGVDRYRSAEDRLRLIRYETFNRDKEASIARLARDVGLDPARSLGEHADRQFQPRGNRKVSWLEFFGEDRLRVIERICGDRMTALGYERARGGGES